MAAYRPGMNVWTDPLSTLRRIQDEVNRGFGSVAWEPAPEFPLLNLWRGEDGIVVTAEIPGVRLEDMDITVHQNTMTLKGNRTLDVQEPEVTFHRREREYGSFARTITLPFSVDANQVKASANNGVLTIELPRPESDKPRKIQIRKA